MPDQAPENPPQPAPEQSPDQDDQRAAATKTRPAPSKPKRKQLPPYKVLLHNDDVNTILDVVNAICQVIHMEMGIAIEKMLEAHHKGISLLLVTHKERAELYQDQLQSYGLTVTIEADGDES